VDLLMAATASVHELVLVTRNTRDVAWTGAEADAIQHVRHGPVIRFGRDGRALRDREICRERQYAGNRGDTEDPAENRGSSRHA
jgi:hypothetical protein